jgi:hypothetical protein
MVSKLNFGTLLHMMGIPRSLSVKLVKKWDYPKPGMVTFAMVPWDVQNNCVRIRAPHSVAAAPSAVGLEECPCSCAPK